MLEKTHINGLSAFPITPTDTAGHVDTRQLRRLASRLSTAEVDSIGLLGSTGIYMYLSREERRRAVEATIDEVNGRTPVVVSIGALRSDEAIRLAQDAKSIGAVAGLLAPVSYTPLTDDEVFELYTTVAHESGLPIIIYNNPATTYFEFKPALQKRLAQVPAIVGIKNPAPVSDLATATIKEQRGFAPHQFSLGYSGDWNATEALIAGGDVWYSVLGGLFQQICLKITRAVQKQDIAEARRLDTLLTPLWNLFKEFSSLRVVYEIANQLDIVHTNPPRPVQPLAEHAKQQVAAVLAELPDDICK